MFFPLSLFKNRKCLDSIFPRKTCGDGAQLSLGFPLVVRRRRIFSRRPNDTFFAKSVKFSWSVKAGSSSARTGSRAGRRQLSTVVGGMRIFPQSPPRGSSEREAHPLLSRDVATPRIRLRSTASCSAPCGPEGGRVRARRKIPIEGRKVVPWR